MRKKILWIKIDPLHPLDKGGNIRTFNMLKEWSKSNEITFACLCVGGISEKARDSAREYSAKQIWVDAANKKSNPILYALDLLKNLFFSRLPYIVYKYRSKAFQKAIREETSKNHYDAIIVDFLQASFNVLESGIDPGKLVLFQHNVESMIWKRHYDDCTNIFLRPYLHSQWRRCATYEGDVCALMAGVVAVSRDDADHFRNDFGLSNVLGYVKTGVDIDFFRQRDSARVPGNIVFLGSMDWMPNINGIIEFVNKVLPLVKRSIPDVVLTIVGRNPSARVKKLESQSVIVTGTVDDVRPFLEGAMISVVPLNVGGGTRLKIFELMAASVPVVSTTIGAEGLPVVDGENILIADGHENMARAVVRLLEDVNLREKISGNALKLLEEKLSWAHVVNEFDVLVETATIRQVG